MKPCRLGCSNVRQRDHICCRPCWRQLPPGLRDDIYAAKSRSEKFAAAVAIYRWLIAQDREARR
jgi:hypothetical protein